MSVADVMAANARRAEALKELVGKRIEIGTSGYVELVNVMGSDEEICRTARTSTGSEKKGPGEDRALIRYMKRHAHSSPFEFAELVFKIRMEMASWRQMVRHRTASISEYSTRYSPAIDATVTTLPEEWRVQAKTNRQGSSEDKITSWPSGYEFVKVAGTSTERITAPDGTVIGNPNAVSPGEYLTDREAQLQALSREVYKERLAFGVALEQARKDLPLSTLTEAYWKSDLHNLMHFLSLRQDKSAQLEIREFANAIGEQFVAPLFPFTWEAFNDFDERRNAKLLTAMEVELVQGLAECWNCSEAQVDTFTQKAKAFGWTLKSGERAEAIVKLLGLGLLTMAAAQELRPKD